MLQPTRFKFRKHHKGKNVGISYQGASIAFGSFALKAMGHCQLTGRQIEAARIAVTRSMKREGKVWIRVFPDKPLTSKPADVRMGKGKGSVDHFITEIAPGRIIFEVEGVTQELAKASLRLAAQKLPILCKFITRYDFEGE